MELMELYNRINNPIDDPSVIKKLINAYANISHGGYYSQLTKTVQKEHNVGEVSVNDADKFHAMLFNKWKNSILAMTKEEFIRLNNQGSYGQDFRKMRNYLKTIPDVSTMKEANNIFYGDKGDKELEGALDNYSWKAFGEGTGWDHVCSRYLTAKKDKKPKVEHRLYLNAESVDIYKVATYLVEKYDQHHLPYYFKFDTGGNRDDTIVIYSSTEDLVENIKILQEIKKEHPELVSKIKDPPVLTGKIDGWIGYGSEPAKTPDGKKHSFNEIRAGFIEASIEKVTKQWIMKYRDRHITYKGRDVSFQDYIAMKSTKKIINDLEKKFLSRVEDGNRYAQYNGTAFDPSTVSNTLGYTLEDVKSPKFEQYIYKILNAQMTDSLSKVCNGNHKDMNEIVINVRNGKQIKFKGFDLETIIQELSVQIAEHDPSFMKNIQTEIKGNAKQHGVDASKLCFDLETVKKMKTIDEQRQQQSPQSGQMGEQ